MKIIEQIDLNLLHEEVRNTKELVEFLLLDSDENFKEDLTDKELSRIEEVMAGFREKVYTFRYFARKYKEPITPQIAYCEDFIFNYQSFVVDRQLTLQFQQDEANELFEMFLNLQSETKSGRKPRKKRN